MNAETPFATIAASIRRHAHDRPQAPALADDDVSLSYAEPDLLMGRIASALQHAGAPGTHAGRCAGQAAVRRCGHGARVRGHRTGDNEA